MTTDQPSWQKISTTELLKHPRVPVVEDMVKLPDGQESFYARILATDAVTVIIRRADGAFLLNQEYRYATDERIHRAESSQPHNGTLFHFPGGTIQPNEGTQTACDREVAEETGVNITDFTKHLLGSVFNYFPRMSSRDYKYFVALGQEYQRHETDHDLGEQGMQQIWLQEAEIDKLIVSNDQRVMHSHFLDCWALYKVKRPA